MADTYVVVWRDNTQHTYASVESVYHDKAQDWIEFLGSNGSVVVIPKEGLKHMIRLAPSPVEEVVSEE